MDAEFDAIGSIIMLAPVIYLLLQIAVPAFLKGRWRIAALLPLVLSVPIAVFCLAAFAMQSNLWPMFFILFAPFGAIYLLGVMGVYWLRG